MATTPETEEIIIGAGDVYIMEFKSDAVPNHETIEVEANKVANCSGGFSVEYKPEAYEVKNQYGKTVKKFIKSEEITAKTGLLTWDLKKLDLLSVAKITEAPASAESPATRKLTLGGGGNLKTVLLRFVHTKDDGLKLRFTIIGQGGNGFSLEFGEEETTVDAEITAVEKVKGFLAEFEEETAPKTEA